jgi:outer membrane protein
MANFYPDLTAKAGMSVGRNTRSVPDDKTYNSLNTAITSTLNLYNGYSDQASLDQSGFSFKSDKETYDRVMQSVVFNTMSAYLNAVLSKERIGVAEENLSDNQKQEGRIEAFYKAGRRPVTDLYQQQAQTASAQLDLLNARQEYRTNKMKLLETIGISAMTPFEPESFSDGLIPDEPVTDAEQLVATAFSNRSDLRAQKDKVNAADMGLRQAKSGYYPTVDLVASLSSSYSSLDSTSMNEQMDDENLDASMSVTISIPVFDRYLTRNQVRKAKVTSNTARLELEKLQRQIEVEIGEAVSDYQAAVKQVDVTLLKLTYAARALESMKQRYEAGAATLIELTQSRAGYIQAQYDKVNAGLNRVIQSVALDFYQGKITGIMSMAEKKE